MKKFLCLLLSALLIISAFPLFEIDALADSGLTSGSCGENVTYSFDSSTGTLTISGSGDMKDYPAAFNSPFYNNEAIKTVNFEFGVTSVCDFAFYGCKGITNVNLPDTIKKIGNSAFADCAGLTNITIPDSVKTIDWFAFKGCSSLTSITIPDNVTSIGFLTCGDCTSLTSVKIGRSVAEIGNQAFKGCTNLASITIPDSVTSIGNEAFLNCTSLTSINIANKDCNIGNDAIPSKATIIGHINSKAKEYADKNSNKFSSLCYNYYVESSRVEPTYTNNGYINYECSVCNNIKTETLVKYRDEADYSRYKDNSTILPVARSVIYKGKIYARFEKPFVNYNNVFSSYFKLAEIPDVETLDIVRGLTNGQTKYYVLGGVRSGNNWKWQYNGNVIDSGVLQWAANEPNNSGGSENQLSILAQNGLLNDINVTEAGSGFVAYTDLNEFAPKSQGYFKTNKYVFYNNTMPFTYAKLICEAKGGYLASITSKEENDVVHGLINNTAEAFIGAERNASGNIEWLSGEKWSYSNWNSGEPNNSANYGGQNFVQMYSSGLWDDCNDVTTDTLKETNGYICEYEPSSLSVRIDQDDTHSVSDSEIHIIANYPDGSTNDITNVAEFSKAYINGNCEVTAWAVKPNGETIQTKQDIKVEGEHTYVQRTVVEPTCTKDGKIAHICSVCKARYDETVPKLEHKYTKHEIDSTCTKEGYILYTCDICGDRYKETLPLKDHEWSEWKTVTPADDENDGLESRVCSVCGKEETRPVAALGHNYVFKQTIKPTCTTGGYDEYVCSTCNKVIKKNVTEASGHTYVSSIIAPTCTEDGYTVYKCTQCGASYKGDYAEKLGHAFGDYVFNNDATELNAGTKTAKCTRCGITDTKNVENTTIFANDTNAIAGQDISIPVYIKNNIGIMGFSLSFEYDKDVLTPVSVSKGQIITDGLDDNIEGDAVPGKFKVIWSGTENLNSNGILFYLNFKVNENSIGHTDIVTGYSQEDTFNESFDDVSLACEKINVNISNDDTSSRYHGTLETTSSEVTAGNTFGISLGNVKSNVTLKTAKHIIEYDNTAFTFLGYADSNCHLISKNDVDSSGSITLITDNGNTYNSKTPSEVFEKTGVKYLLFKANDYASSGTYVFNYTLQNVEGVDKADSSGCEVKINPSATSEVANVYIENGLSGEYDNIVTVPVHISNNKGILGYMINFEYNPEQLEIVMAQKGSLFPGNFNDTIGSDEKGKFSILWNATDDIAKDGVLLNLSFRVLSDEDVLSGIKISYSQDDTFNSNYEDVKLNCIDGSIHLNEEESHEFTDTVIAPTPNSKGYTKHTCINCGYTYTDNETDYANDMSALAAALDKVAKYNKEDYSSESYKNMQEVYLKYIDYPNQSIPQTVIDNATSDILTAIAELVPYLRLTIEAENGSVTVNGINDGTEYSFLFGQTIVLTAEPDEGYTFNGWYETVTQRIRSNEATLSFVITSNTDFKAIFAKEKSAKLSFKTDDGWIAASFDKTADEWGKVTSINDLLPKVPYKLGFTNGRWDYDNDSVMQKLKNGENVIITPKYDKTDYENPLIPTPINSEPALDLYYRLDESENVGSFTMAAGIPEGCRVESVAIAFYRQKAYEFNPADFELTINNKLLTSKFAASNEDGIYTVDITKFSSRYNWSARGYVTYYDKENNLKVAYSNQINIVGRQQIN